MLYWQHVVPWLSHNLSLSSIIPDRSFKQHPMSAQCWCKSLLVSQHFCVHKLESSGEYHLWIHSYFSNSTLHVLFVLLVWFVRWEVSSCTAAVLWCIASRICSKQPVVFLSSSHLVFSSSILLASIWCNRIVVLSQPHSGRNLISFYLRDNISIWSLTCQ